MKTHILLIVFIVLVATPVFAQPHSSDRIPFVLKNTLGYHRMFRAEGPGVAYGFTMNRNEKTPKSWPIGTTLYFSNDGETVGGAILTITADDAGKTLNTEGRQASKTRNGSIVNVRFRNNSLLPRKVTIITYRPDESGNGTNGVFMLPGATIQRSYAIGTKVFIADQQQVDMVMSGKRIDTNKPFLAVQKENEGKTFNIITGRNQ